MRVHSIKKINELKRLRKKGYSISELVVRLSMPKTTIWHHVHNIRIVSKFAKILRAKGGGSAKRAKRNWEKARELAANFLKSHDRELSVIVAMLYWSEGSKKVCEFINSDGRMIEIYLKILRKVLKISKERIKPTMRIFSGMSRTKCLNYWSDITQIPKREFIVRFNDGSTARGKTKYGMCRITVRKGSNTLKLMHSLVDKIFEEVIRHKRPRSSMDRTPRS